MDLPRFPKKLKRLSKAQEEYALSVIRQLLSSPRLPLTVALCGGSIYATLELPGGRICFTISDPGEKTAYCTMVDATVTYKGREVNANYWKDGSNGGTLPSES